jgi:hypothetical protein
VGTIVSSGSVATSVKTSQSVLPAEKGVEEMIETHPAWKGFDLARWRRRRGS